MRILIATDAWLPQVNGVVRTLQSTAKSLDALSHEVRGRHRADGSHDLNCGDWVESCTAIVEHLDGRFAIVRWAEETAPAEAALARAVAREAAARASAGRAARAPGAAARS